MKRKLFILIVAIAIFSLIACEEDLTVEEMNDLIQNTDFQIEATGNGSGNDGSQGGGNGKPGDR